MGKKFVPTPEQLEQILTRYEETKNYSLVSRETGLGPTVIKRIIEESTQGEVATTKEKNAAKPTSTSPKANEYFYVGPAPRESFLPIKKDYYTVIYNLMKEKLNV